MDTHAALSSSDRQRNSPALNRLSDCIEVSDDNLGRSIVSCLDRYEAKANERGIWLEYHTDFDHFADINNGIDKLPLWTPFDPTQSNVGALNAFWIKGMDNQGEIVHTQAVRFDDLTDTYLASHLTSLRAFYSDPDKNAHPEEICEVKAPACYTITGGVCFQGELWIAKRFRGSDLARILPKLSMAITLARWSPDYLYGLVDSFVVEKGIVAKYGHYNIQPHGTIHHLPQRGLIHDDWIEWATWREMVDQIERS